MSRVKPHTIEVEQSEEIVKPSEPKTPKPHTVDAIGGEIVDEEPFSEVPKSSSLKQIVNFLASIWGLLAGVLFFVIMVLVGEFMLSVEDMLSSPSLSDILYSVGFLALLSVVGLHIQRIIAQINSLRSAEELKKEYDTQKQNPSHDIIKLSTSLVKRYSDESRDDLSGVVNRLKTKLGTSPVYDELYRLNQDVYLELDKKADRIIKNASIQAGLTTAISPLPTVDMLLTLYRSVYLAKELSSLYGYKPGLLTTYSIIRQALFNIAFAGSSEALLEYIPEIGTSSAANIFSKSAGQGVANGVLMARIGQSIKESCRPISIDDRDAERSIVRAIVMKLGMKDK